MNSQLTLFDLDTSFLPSPFEGETLYSWCARFHRLSTNIWPQLTSRQLFNSAVAGFRHDFPTHLDNFSVITNRIFGSPGSLVFDRTICSLFAPFLSRITNESVIQEMRQGGYAQIINLLGLRANGLATIAPFKACPICMQEDTASSGIAWWHVEHQFPTVRICSRHGVHLLIATQEFHSRPLKIWLLPADLQLHHWQIAPILNELCISRLRNICNWSRWLVKFHDQPFNSDLLCLTYHLRAKTIGLSAIDGSMNFNKFRLAFREAYACLENLSGFSFIRDTAYEHGGFLNDILLKRGVHKHPLRHVIMLEFLFSDPDVFITEYQRVNAAASMLNKQDFWNELTDSRSPLKLLVADAGYSVNAAAKQLNIPVYQAISFLKKEGIEYRRRQKQLDQQTETTLIDLLKAGKERDEIASTLGVRKSFIINYVAKRPDLHNAWKIALQNNYVETLRSRFLQFLIDNPGLPIKSIKDDLGSVFLWLQQNDKKWLKQNLPGIWQPSPINSDSVSQNSPQTLLKKSGAK